MRDIKFRTWNKEMGIMDYGNELTGYNEFECSPLRAVNDIINQNYPELVWMQYTGLKDIKGLSIYEGDIIEGGYLNPLTNEFLSRKYIVTYANAEFKGELIGHSPYGDTGLRFIKGYVVGNIYENPELLEV